MYFLNHSFHTEQILCLWDDYCLQREHVLKWSLYIQRDLYSKQMFCFYVLVAVSDKCQENRSCILVIQVEQS